MKINHAMFTSKSLIDLYIIKQSIKIKNTFAWTVIAKVLLFSMEYIIKGHHLFEDRYIWLLYCPKG